MNVRKMGILWRTKCDPPNNSPPAPHCQHDNLMAKCSDCLHQCCYQKNAPAVEQDTNQYVHENEDKGKQCRANIRKVCRNGARAAVQANSHEARKHPAPDIRKKNAQLTSRYHGHRCVQVAADWPWIGPTSCLLILRLAAVLIRAF